MNNDQEQKNNGKRKRTGAKKKWEQAEYNFYQKHIVITLNIKRPVDQRENMLLFSTPLKFSLSLIKVFGQKLKFQALESHEAKVKRKKNPYTHESTYTFI